MSNKTQWIIYSAIVLIILLLVVIFSKNIWNWFENVLIDVLIYWTSKLYLHKKLSRNFV